MPKPKVSRAQAEAVVAAIKAKWPESEGWSYIDGPNLHDADHEEQPEGCWSIAWEGAPEDWAYYASMEIKVPGVHLESLYHWCLGLYPDEYGGYEFCQEYADNGSCIHSDHTK